jgi:hypothetical protein
MENVDLKNEAPTFGNTVLGEGDLHNMKVKAESRKLVFDKDTGELILKNETQEKENVITDIYVWGFFAFA